MSAIDLRPDDALYVLGDVIDRGPDGCKILLDMMGRPNVIPILGNHEFTAAVCLPWLLEEVTDCSLANLDDTRLAALQEWIVNGGGPTLRELQGLSRAGRGDILDYLWEMELYAEAEAGGVSSSPTPDWTTSPRASHWMTMSWRIFSSAAPSPTRRSGRTGIWSMATHLPTY